jgi:hypothetical protein
MKYKNILPLKELFSDILYLVFIIGNMFRSTLNIFSPLGKLKK